MMSTDVGEALGHVHHLQKLITTYTINHNWAILTHYGKAGGRAFPVCSSFSKVGKILKLQGYGESKEEPFNRIVIGGGERWRITSHWPANFN